MSILRGLRRPVAACSAVLLAVLVLTGCGPAAQPSTAVAFSSAEQHGATVVDSPREGALRLVPRHRNGALAVYLHGWNQTRLSLITRPTKARVAERLAGAGFVVLSADAGLKAWGDPASVDDYARLIRRTSARYGLRDVFLMGESMGGLATMRLAAQLPDVRAVVAWYPVCDLRTMREARFQQTIRTAWRGEPRRTVSPVRAGRTPMLVWASTDDTVVHAATNAGLCVREARAAGARATWFRTSGDHGDPSNFDPAAVLAFFESHRTPGPDARSGIPAA